jgi:hypothetical protein
MKLDFDLVLALDERRRRNDQVLIDDVRLQARQVRAERDDVIGRLREVERERAGPPGQHESRDDVRADRLGAHGRHLERDLIPKRRDPAARSSASVSGMPGPGGAGGLRKYTMPAIAAATTTRAARAIGQRRTLGLYLRRASRPDALEVYARAPP